MFALIGNWSGKEAFGWRSSERSSTCFAGPHHLAAGGITHRTRISSALEHHPQRPLHLDAQMRNDGTPPSTPPIFDNGRLAVQLDVRCTKFLLRTCRQVGSSPSVVVMRVLQMAATALTL